MSEDSQGTGRDGQDAADTGENAGLLKQNIAMMEGFLKLRRRIVEELHARGVQLPTGEEVRARIAAENQAKVYASAPYVFPPETPAGELGEGSAPEEKEPGQP